MSEFIPVPFRIIENGKVDCIDLKILKGMIDQKSLRDIATEIGVAEKTVFNRLEDMQNNKIIQKRSVPAVDILQLYNFVFITYVKLKLSAAIPEVASDTSKSLSHIAPTPVPPAWEDSLQAIKSTDKVLFSKIVRCAFVVTGTEWDLALLISTQSLDEYTNFFAQLQKRGFIEKISGQQISTCAGYTFDPISVPDYEEFSKGLEQTRKYLSIKEE